MIDDPEKSTQAQARAQEHHLLKGRMEEFARAMSAGGRRESYLGWQASRTALAAAAEILAVLEKCNG